jgi:predicted phosphate transport protein (TIGR00153 family)
LPKFSLFPRVDKFFILFEQSAQNAVKMAHQLKDLIYIWENVKERVGIINDFEHEGDAITHQLMAQLNRYSYTPLDREDIAALTLGLDEISDYIESVADTLLNYNVDRPTETAKQLSDIIVQATTEVEIAVSQMRVRIEKKKILERCIEINRLENIGDTMYRALMGELFADSTNIEALIKWREIYRHMETVLDKCEDVARILEGICARY